MHTGGLFHTVLIRPALHGADELRIVSGYASPECARHHLGALEALGLSVNISLVIGMTGEEGLDVEAHRMWMTLVGETAPTHGLAVRYMPRGSSDHSKTYLWLSGGQPLEAWTGSANYSSSGFSLKGESRFETLTDVPPDEAKVHVDIAFERSVPAYEAEMKGLVDFYRVVRREAREEVAREPVPDVNALGPRVSLPLVQQRNGEVHNAGAGLNWGQRGSRNRSEAYIPVPRNVQESGFFPPSGDPFRVRTTDGLEMTMVRAQQNGKALETPDDNALLGQYLRTRMGLAPDAFVTTADLERFGSKHVDFVRLPDETYLLEFEPRAFDKPLRLGIAPPDLKTLESHHKDRLTWFHDRAGTSTAGWPGPTEAGNLLASRAKGIFKPENFEYAVSVRIVPDGDYADGRILRRADGTWAFAYHQEGKDPSSRDDGFTNRALMACIRDAMPVGVFEEMDESPGSRKSYWIHGLAIPVGWWNGFFLLEGYGPSGPDLMRDTLRDLTEKFGLPYQRS